MVAHRLSTVRHADQIVVMAHGKVIEQGTHAYLLANPTGAQDTHETTLVRLLGWPTEARDAWIALRFAA